MGSKDLKEVVAEAFLIALDEGRQKALKARKKEIKARRRKVKKPVASGSNNPGGEEGEELRGAFPYKGKSPYKGGNIYYDREGYDSDEYAKAGDWSSDVSKKNAPHGHQFSSARTRKNMARLKKQNAKELPAGTKVTGLDSAGASVEDLAKRAASHGRGSDTHKGLRKDDPKYHQAAVKAAGEGKLKSSWGAETDDNTFGMGGGRTSARHHQLAGVQPKVKTIPRAEMARAARSATRRHKAEKSGKMDAVRARLKSQGKFMREQIKNAVLRYLNEGPRTGNSPTQTMAMGGRFMRRLKKSVDSGETGQDVLDSKKAQANRINRKVADRQANYATSHGYDPKSVEKVRTQSKRRGSDSYYKGQGNPHKIPGLDDPSMERAPANAPNPTDVRRRAKGQEAYPRRTMQASEQFKKAVLEYLSPEAYKNRLSQSADMVTKDQSDRTGKTPIKGNIQAGREIGDKANTRSDRVSRVQRGRRGGGNSRLQRKGFDDQNMPSRPKKSRPPTLKLGNTLDIESRPKH